MKGGAGFSTIMKLLIVLKSRNVAKSQTLA